MEPVSQRVDIAGARQAGSEGQKSGPSKFDRLRADLNQKFTEAAQLPPKITNVNNLEKEVLQNDLRRKLASGKGPQEVVAGEMGQLRTRIADLNRQVAAVPATSAFAPLRERLKSIESDFNASSRLLTNPGSLDDPKRLLEMQMEVYKLAENVEIMSRTVSEVASGAKTILQTQV
jgi:uncharacterized protein YhaN